MAYITVSNPNEHGHQYAMLIPSSAAPQPDQAVRFVRYAEDLAPLQREWGTDDVRAEVWPPSKP